MPPSPLLYEQQQGGRDRLVFSDSFFRAVRREIITTASLSEYADDDNNKSDLAAKNAVETVKEERDDEDDMYDHDRRFWYDGEHTFLEGKEKTTRGYIASAVMSAHKMDVGERC